MKAIAPVTTPVLVEIVEGQPTTTSLDVASHFGKRHDTVLRAVRQLECSPEFRLHNFAEASQEVAQPNGGVAKYPVVRMTRDGFTFLCMGFTGKEAGKWKEAYISAFNQMEVVLKEGVPAKAKRKPKLLTDGLSDEQQEAIKALVKARVDELPEGKRAKAAITCWSSLKSKFGCTYKEIAPERFTEAVSLIARVTLEGEWMPKQDGIQIEAGPLRRYLVSFNHVGEQRITEIPHDACVLSHRDLIKGMLTPGEIMVSTEEMFEFAMSALTSLKARSDYQANRLREHATTKRPGDKA